MDELNPQAARQRKRRLAKKPQPPKLYTGSVGSPKIDIAGKHFGNWRVIRLDKRRSAETRRAYWICECECGLERSVRGSHLIAGSSTMCCAECPKRLED